MHTAYKSVVSEDGKSIKYKAHGVQVGNAKSDGPWASKRTFHIVEGAGKQGS